MVAFSWLCWLFWIVFDCVLFWLVLVVASSVWFWLGVFGCVVLVRPNCYWLCWLWPDYEWLCLAELVGLGCAVLVVAGLCSAWRPPPPASMKAAAWPATAFLHSRAAAQLPPHYYHNNHHNSAAQPPPQLLPLKSCRGWSKPQLQKLPLTDLHTSYNQTPQHNWWSPYRAHSKPTHTTTSEAGGGLRLQQPTQLQTTEHQPHHNRWRPELHKRPLYTTKLKINGCERLHCEQSLNHNHIGCKSAPIVKRAQQALGRIRA